MTTWNSEPLKMKVLVTKSSQTLSDPMDCSPHQVPLSMGFFRQEYWSRSSFPTSEDLPNPCRQTLYRLSPKKPTFTLAWMSHEHKVPNKLLYILWPHTAVNLHHPNTYMSLLGIAWQDILKTKLKEGKGQILQTSSLIFWLKIAIEMKIKTPVPSGREKNIERKGTWRV